MTATIIDGKAISQSLIDKMSQEVAQLEKSTGKRPGLVTILVGNHPASISYVSLKIKVAKKIGFHEVQRNLAETISQDQLLETITKYNDDPSINGILVQLPLPPQIDQEQIMLAIDPTKDVDCFHPQNLGNLFIHYKKSNLSPCTPSGVMELLHQTNTEITGKHVVVIGRSNLVGKPIALMLMQKTGGSATVTVVHSKTKNIFDITKQADILISAIGQAEFVKKEGVKPGAVVIDVGVNQVGEVEKNGKMVAQLKGDVAFNEVIEVASAITPVPGGVGPMTITFLMQNTLKSFKHSLKTST